jgi:hypothetical protein
MVESGIYPDFIIVDGKEGGAGCRSNSPTGWACRCARV